MYPVEQLVFEFLPHAGVRDVYLSCFCIQAIVKPCAAICTCNCSRFITARLSAPRKHTYRLAERSGLSGSSGQTEEGAGGMAPKPFSREPLN